MPPIIFGRKSWEYISDINLFCLVNVYLFQFKVPRCSAFFSLFFFKSETQESPKFPDKER